jgi:primary-amine oxidase
MRKRGVTDFALAQVDPWPTGYTRPEDAPHLGRKILGLTWVRRHPQDNGYARPIEGLIVHFDLDAMRVTAVEDHGVVPVPPRDGNYTPDAITDPANFPHFPHGVRRDVKPLEITQPEGPSFSVSGHEVRWQKWVFRIGFTHREGLVLYMIGYEDQGRLRPLIYRASLCEMFIPYGDARPTHYRKSVFDMGEFGLGMWTNSLQLGCDCLGEIRYFDAVINDDDGKAVPIPNAICLHEEDHGILWKHTDFRTGDVEVRRSRRLVVSSIVTVGNYEYAFYWYFYQDGSIEYEVKLTGVMSDGAVTPGEKPAYGELVAPGVYGPNHQHFFNVRLDMMLDGVQNSVYEANTEAVPWGEDNPLGNAWVVKRTLLARESEAQRTTNAASARYWIIANPNVLNALGQPVAYRLLPGANGLPFCQPDAPAIQRAGYATKHLWVTAYDPRERYAAGDYPYQHPGGAGLPSYVRAPRPLENTDVVVWYTFGAHHVVRPEEWPVMPVMQVGFHLKPDGFFDGNPALDVPPSASHCR